MKIGKGRGKRLRNFYELTRKPLGFLHFMLGTRQLRNLQSEKYFKMLVFNRGDESDQMKLYIMSRLLSID